MGDQRINQLSEEDKREFLRHLIDDIAAMEYMVSEGMIETGITRIGAEQEFCLVGNDRRPSMAGPRILSDITDPHYTAELAKWNLEINLDPQDLTGDCYGRMHRQLDTLLALGHEKAAAHEANIILTGILPTIRKSELDFKNMTPNPRYRVLDQSMKEQRGEDFNLYIEGVDELSLKHGSILFEAVNTSFQIHLQVSPDEFVDRYNWAQVIAGPVLAACVNSPILLGKELWSETRIAVFRQSIDVRNTGNYIRERQPRVAFGRDWLAHGAAEIFKDDISQYNLIVTGDIEENSMDVLRNGGIPELRAMNLHNGTIYKWNRACYGIGGGVPHLRIENRYIPAGPTTVDEMAATVFWSGLMMAMPDQYRGAWDKHMYFQDVRCNFLKAARNGLANELSWMGKNVDAPRLIIDTLLPMAEQGLLDAGLEKKHFAHYLEVIEGRARNKQTGARWIIDAVRASRSSGASKDESLLMVTERMQALSKEGAPVHTWPLPTQMTLVDIPGRFDRIDSFMSTDLITVREDDILLLAHKLMEWHDYTTLPVENSKGNVVGLIARGDIKGLTTEEVQSGMIKEYMQEDIVTIGPEGSLEKARKAMKLNDSRCLPVVKDGHLVGVVTKSDIRGLKDRQ